MQVRGSARSLLTAERVALNFMSHMSGIATLTKRYVDAIADTKPGFAAHARRHRISDGPKNMQWSVVVDVITAWDLMMPSVIKDNHIALVGDMAKAVQVVRDEVGHTTKVEVEVDTLEQLREF